MFLQKNRETFLTKIYFEIPKNSAFLNPRTTALLCDRSVYALYKEFIHQLKLADIIVVPEGESAKSREVKAYVEDQLFKLKQARDTQLLCMGGGVVCDLGGFVAATFMRGIAHVFLPTTLLAMVDASIGGKTAINTDYGKNTLGSFYEPQEVWIDTHFLQTLHPSQIFEGQVEMLKLAALQSRQDYQRALAAPSDIAQIKTAIEGKRLKVAQDFRDQSCRLHLNWGHSVAHAVEGASGYRCSHGQAVAFGLLVEAAAAHLLGKLALEDCESLHEDLLGLQAFNTQEPSFFTEPAALYSWMEKDKKAKAGQPQIVVWTGWGSCQDKLSDLDYKTFKEAWAFTCGKIQRPSVALV